MRPRICAAINRVVSPPTLVASISSVIRVIQKLYQIACRRAASDNPDSVDGQIQQNSVESTKNVWQTDSS